MYSTSEYIPTIEYDWLKKRGKDKTEYLSRWISLDTETSHTCGDNPVGWVHQWAVKFGNDVIIGRTPDDLITFFNTIIEWYQIDKSRRVVIYVHNLSYDIQYLKDYLTRAYGESKILAIAAHRFITYRVGGLEFRCSYKLSNKSLALWSKDLGCVHQKIEETKDFYHRARYQDETLSDDDWVYQVMDVKTLDECIERQMAAYGDNVATIPLTSTGYVRRECRKNYNSITRNRRDFKATAIDGDVYECLRNAFSGGLSEGNRFLWGKTLIPESAKGESIRHGDFRSHYPSQQRMRKFPVGKFVKLGVHLDIDTIRKAAERHCLLMYVTFDGMTLKTDVKYPCISACRAYRGRKGDVKTTSFNGRLLKLEGMTTLALTDIDLKWVLHQYKIGSYDIDVCWMSYKGYLPDFMTKTIDDFYLGKSRWKKAEKSAKTRVDKIYAHVELLKSKNGLNGIYGMSATDPVRESYMMDDVTGEWSSAIPDADKALKKYHNSDNSFMRYAWGVWTTAFARDELLTVSDVIQNAGGTPLYCDTDSIFYVSRAGVQEAIEQYNNDRYAFALKHKAYIECDGELVTYDAFDDEGEDITAFRYLHSKCYAYETKDGGLTCVIAGVTPFEDATHAYTREDELGDIDSLTAQKIFTRCGGTSAKYVEAPITTDYIDGHITTYASACIISDTTKTLHDPRTLGEDFTKWEVIQ